MTRVKVKHYVYDTTASSRSGYYTEEKFFSKRENAEQWVKGNVENYTYTYLYAYPKPKTYLPEFEIEDLTLEDE